MATSIAVPQVQVQILAEPTPPEAVEARCPAFVGPHGQLFEYNDDDKATILLGDYNPDEDTGYVWPNRPAGAVVSEDDTALFIEDAKCPIFTDELGDDETVAPVSGSLNRVRRTDDIETDTGFVENGDYPRIAALLDRDVTKGDGVYLRGVVDGDVVEHTSYVLDVEGDDVDAVVGEAVSDDDNPEDQSENIDITDGDANESTLVLTADLSNYNGLIDGHITETYTVTVTNSSSGGDITTGTFKIRSASGEDDADDIAPTGAGVFFEVGARGLQLKFTGADDLVAGDEYTVAIAQDFDEVVAVSGGEYTGSQDTTYIVEVKRGGRFDAADDADKPYISVTTNNGYDGNNGLLLVSDDNTEVSIGTHGVTVMFNSDGSMGALGGMPAGAIFTIPCTAATTGRMSTLVLGTNMPDAMLDATDLKLEIFLKKTVEVPRKRVGYDPLTNFDTSDTEVTINSGMILYDSTYTDGGVEQPLLVTEGRLYVQYQVWLADVVNKLQKITASEAIGDRLSGAIDSTNPLKLGLFFGRLNANGMACYYIAVSDPTDDEAWEAAIKKLTGVRDIHDIVCLTDRFEVQKMLQEHVASESSSTAGRRRRMWIGSSLPQVQELITSSTTDDEEHVLAKIIDDPETSGTQYTYLVATSGNADFVTNEVQAGDTVRYLFHTEFDEESYTEFEVDEVINEDTIRLVSGHTAAVNTPQRVEIWRPLVTSKTASPYAAEIADDAGSWGDDRVSYIWPDTFEYGTEDLPSYYLACCLAGLRGGAAPHQSLTNVQILGPTSVDRTNDLFSAGDLDVMASSGTCIVMQDESGNIICRHCVTTDMTDINTREEQAVSNADSVAAGIQSALQRFVGKTNAHPITDALIRAEGDRVLSKLKSVRYAPALGSQILNTSSIISVQRHATQRDKTVVNYRVFLVYPNNYIDNFVVI